MSTPDRYEDRAAVQQDPATVKDRLKGLKGKALTEAKEVLVVQFRQAGVTFERIAQVVGYADHAGASKAFQRRVHTVEVEASDEVRWLELGRLEEYHRAFYPRVLRGDIKAGEFLLKVHDRRAKLLGLDAPSRYELTSTDALEAEYERLVAEEERAQRWLDSNP